MKKVASLAAAGALLLTTAGAAFAFDMTVVKNKAKVKTFTLTVANSGLNSMSADDDVKGGKIKTGDAAAYGEVNNLVNATEVDNCGCSGFTVVKNKAKVRTMTVTVANSGLNSMSADDDVKGGKIKTGDAEAASVVTNMVNTTVVGDDTTE